MALLTITAGLLVLADGAAAAVEAKGVLGPDHVLYGTQAAADLVAEARKYDPLYCKKEAADRDRAVSLYEQAIEAQSGASINALLSERIAQLYGYYEDREKGARPMRAEAQKWWKRSVELSTSRELIWGRAQIGIASMAAIGQDYRTALEAYGNILGMDANAVELPQWDPLAHRTDAKGQAMVEQEQTRLRQALGELQSRTVDAEFYVLCRVDRATARAVLQSLAARYRGSPAGDRALEVLSSIPQPAGADLLPLPSPAPVQGNAQEPVSEPAPSAQPQHVTPGAELPRLVVPGQTGGASWIWPVCGVLLAVVGAGVVVTVKVRSTRWRRTR